MTPTSETFAAFEYWPRWASRLLLWVLLLTALLCVLAPPLPAAPSPIHVVFQSVQPMPIEAAARFSTDLSTTP